MHIIFQLTCSNSCNLSSCSMSISTSGSVYGSWSAWMSSMASKTRCTASMPASSSAHSLSDSDAAPMATGDAKQIETHYLYHKNQEKKTYRNLCPCIVDPTRRRRPLIARRPSACASHWSAWAPRLCRPNGPSVFCHDPSSTDGRAPPRWSIDCADSARASSAPGLWRWTKWTSIRAIPTAIEYGLLLQPFLIYLISFVWHNMHLPLGQFFCNQLTTTRPRPMMSCNRWPLPRNGSLPDNRTCNMMPAPHTSQPLP